MATWLLLDSDPGSSSWSPSFSLKITVYLLSTNACSVHPLSSWVICFVLLSRRSSCVYSRHRPHIKYTIWTQFLPLYKFKVGGVFLFNFILGGGGVCFCFFFFFWDHVSYSTGWPQTHHIAKASLEFWSPSPWTPVLLLPYSRLSD